MMNDEFYLDVATRIANQAFADKLDKAGVSYTYHLQRVSSKFKDHTAKRIIAILHDLLEDCPEWNEKSLGTLFSVQIVTTIVALTHRKDESYEAYIERISKNIWATEIKIADLEDNMDIKRLPELTEKDFERLQKYHKAYNYLKSK